MAKKPVEDPEDEDYIDPDAPRSVITYRNAQQRPVVVPREVALEMDTIYRCHEAHLSGKTWVEIAQDEGFPSGASCKATVDRYMSEARALIAEDTGKKMLQREIETLDYMQTKLWPFVQAGSEKAIDQVLKIQTKRVEWQSLAVKDDDAKRDMLTMIVPGETYKSYLQDQAVRGSLAKESAVTSTSSVTEDPTEE